MQEVALARIEERMLEAVGAMSPDALLKLWVPLVQQNAEQFRDLCARSPRRIRLDAERQELGGQPTGLRDGRELLRREVA